MNQTIDPAWSQAEHFDPVSEAAEHDFASFLDLDGLDLDFPIPDFADGDAQDDGQPGQLLGISKDHEKQPDISPAQPHNAGQSAQHQNVFSAGSDITGLGNDLFDFSIDTPLEQPQQRYPIAQDNAFRSQAMVPPTPNSAEMHVDTARYLQQLDAQTRAILEQNHQLRKADMATLTPLVSPAFTPYDAHFQMPMDLTVPGAYFSPLTSPALEAQRQRAYQNNTYTSSSSITTSPVDREMDLLGEAAVALEEPAHKLKRKSTTTKTSGASTRVRQSPIVKPRGRKPTLSSSIPPKEINDLLLEVQRARGIPSQPISNGLAAPRSTGGSEGSSISPEPLSEVVMGPPPKPGSGRPSPNIVAIDGFKPSVQGANSQGPCPATPASLMRLPQSQNSAPNGAHTPLTSPNQQATEQTDAQPIMEDLTLPDAAAPPMRPSLSRVNTAVRDDQATPRLSARKTPNLGPLSTPLSATPSSAKASPIINGLASPPSASPFLGKKPDPKLARGNKKRNSTNPTLVSPALRPKISPNIKPLLPEGAHSDDARTLLLASKSNYQNLLDGTHVPGVSYPETLSTNLTSKRTSHKLAEQGRRNRINTALQEMQALLPSPGIAARDSASGRDGGAGAGSGGATGSGGSRSPDGAAAAGSASGGSGNSKAATVESAIEYIRLLQREARERDEALKSREREVEELKRRLGEAERRWEEGAGRSGVVK